MSRSILRISAAALLASLGVLASGCTDEAFCFDCATIDGGPPGMEFDGGGTGGHGGGLGVGAGGGGAGGSGGGLGLHDAGCNADVMTDPINCGTCGNECLAPNAVASCVAGACKFACADGTYDHNGDLGKLSGDGCEYRCKKTSTTETCNGLDDNCDGQVDEGMVCNTVLNCGTFGTACLYPHSQGECDNGVCKESTCKPGFFPDKTKPLPNCEYACNPTDMGKEVCDGKDNDCNGKIDDNPDVSSDPLHCGACDKTCIGAFANSEPTCKAGKCVLGTCVDGYFDKDMKPANGCEYTCKDACHFPYATGVCQPDGGCAFGTCLMGHVDTNKDPKDGCECALTNGGVEICDGLDNDCDGKIDNGFDTATDTKNCGSCGFECAPFFPNSDVACTAGMCSFVSCKPGYVAPGGNTSAGCQYMCAVTNGGVEICDGLDNDCNGIPDDGVTGTGTGCDTGLMGECKAGKTACSGGKIACVGLATSVPELCDGLDNDCNGTPDDGPSGGPLPGENAACGKTQLGTCTFGTTKCVGGMLSCIGETDPVAETCDNKDNDCDGIVDDNIMSTVCGSSLGVCKQGMNVCNGGVTTCVGGVAAGSEVCDGATAGTGLDENCDGMSDEGCVFGVDAPLRLDTLGSAQGQYSTFLLSNASVGSEYLVAYTDERNGNADIFVRSSTDSGSTWGANDVAAVASGSIEVEPNVFMRAGHAYLTYSFFNGAVRRIYMSGSASPYTAWSAGKLVRDPMDGNVDCYGPQGLVAKSAAGVDWLAVVWSEIAGTAINPTRNVRLSYSKDSGATWSGAILINKNSTDKAELPVIATDNNGVVYIAWRDKRTVGIAPVYFASVDLNAGAPAVTTSIPLQNVTVANASAAQITIAASASAVDVAWVDLRNKAKTIRVAASSDGGVTWTKIGGVVDGNVIVDLAGQNSDAAAPAIAVQNSAVIAAWEDTRSGLSDIRFNHSTDGGVTWQTTNPRVDTGDGLGADASYGPQGAFGQGNHVFVAWQDIRFLSSSVLVSESLDSGKSWHANSSLLRADVDTPDLQGPPQNDGASADSQSPIILASPNANQASVVWIDFRGNAGQNGVNGDVWSRLYH